MNSSPTTLCLRPRELATRSSLIGCTGLLAESGILRTRAGRHRQRARHAASGRGRTCATSTSSPSSSASATGPGPPQRPGRRSQHASSRRPTARCRRRPGLAAAPSGRARRERPPEPLPYASRRHAAGLGPTTALRAGAARPTTRSAHPRRTRTASPPRALPTAIGPGAAAAAGPAQSGRLPTPADDSLPPAGRTRRRTLRGAHDRRDCSPRQPPARCRPGPVDRSPGGHSVPDRRLPVSPHWTALRAGTVCLFADCSSPPPAVGPRPARIARPFAGRALCARSPGSRLLAGRRPVAGPDPPTVSGRAQCTCSPEARLLTGRRPAAGPVPPDRSPGGRRAARPPDTRLLTGRRLGSGRFRRLLSGGRQ